MVRQPKDSPFRRRLRRPLPLLTRSVELAARDESLVERLAREHLPGLAARPERERFAGHVEHWIRAYEWRRQIARDPGDVEMRDPVLDDPHWSPLRAIVQWARANDESEATWLAFLVTFFGPHERGNDQWLAVRTVYSGFGEGRISWEDVSDDRRLLADVCRRHRALYEKLPRGNHRKYEPKAFDHKRGLAGSVRSLADVVVFKGGMHPLFHGDDRSPEARFDRLMRELAPIVSFGRTGRFDLLALLGGLGVWKLEPGRLYLSGATGPLKGARRMIARGCSIAELDRELRNVAVRIGVPIEAMEDALCNWQKA